MTTTIIRLATRTLLALLAGGAAMLGGRDAAAITKYTAQSGPWESATTWNLGLAPLATDDAIILGGHVVTTGNTSANITYTIRSLEVRANGRLESGTNTFRSYLRTTADGPTGYAVLNSGQIIGQLNRTSAVECAGNLRTDGSGISNRASQPMGGYSWGWNNQAHAGNGWPHGHGGNSGDSTPGICLVLTGGTPSTPATVSQGGTVNVDTPGASAGPDALPRMYVRGHYRLASSLEMNAFEQAVEMGASLDLAGWRLLARGPVHVGDTGFNSVAYAMAADGTAAVLQSQNFTPIPGSGGSGYSNVQTLWAPGASATVSYSTAPKRIVGFLPSSWSNPQGVSGTFSFYGRNVRDLWVSVNGWVGFLSSYANGYPPNQIPAPWAPNAFAAPGAYYQALSGARGQFVRAALFTPSSGNREYVVEWFNEYAWGSATAPATQHWFQVRLEESTNVVRFRYSSGTIVNGNPTWRLKPDYTLIGVEDAGGSNGTVYGTSAWATSQTEPTTHLKFTPQFPASPTASLRIGDGAGTANQGTWPQFRITAGASCIWGTGARVEIPAGSNGSMMLGVAVNLTGDGKLRVLSQPSPPTALQGWSNAGRAPTAWVIGFLAIADTAEIEVAGPTNAATPYTARNPYNAMLQVGQALEFADLSQNPPLASSGHIRLRGASGTFNTANPTGPQPFPVLLVQGGVGGGSNFVTSSVWRGQAGGTRPGIDTAGMTIESSTFVHQGGLAAVDGFQLLAQAETGGSPANPGSAWGLHSIYVGLAANGTIPLANGTNLELGGPSTVWNLDGVALSINGNRQAVNGGGGNCFVMQGAFLGHRGIAANLPADGSIGMVDCTGTLQVTGTARWYQGQLGGWSGGAVIPTGSMAPATLRVLGQGTLPPGVGSGPPAQQRQAPLGNLSIDDGGSLQSVDPGNVLVFIGEKWHSASVTVKIHPSKVIDLIDGASVSFSASGGNGTYAYSVVQDTPGSGGTAGSISGATYTAGTAGTGTKGIAVVRVTDGRGESFDAVVSYGRPTQGGLGLSPGWYQTGYYGYVTGLRSNVSGFTPTVQCNAFAGAPPYAWSVSGNGTLSATSGASVTFTAGTSTATGILVLRDSAGALRTCYMYHSTSTTFGNIYPSPYYMYHLRVGTSQTLRLNPGAVSGTPSWTFARNTTGATYNTGLSVATGTSVTLNAGTLGGLTPYDSNYYTQGMVVSTSASSGATQTGYFYFYCTVQPSDLAITPRLIEGLSPGTGFAFTATGGQTPYSWAIAQNGGNASVSGSGAYTAGPASATEDVLDLTDGWGVSRQATVRKGLPTPANGNSYRAVPGARTIFTNSTVNAVDQIVFADVNDDLGRLQVLKTLSSGTRVIPASLEVTPVLITMVSGTSQVFSVPGDTSTTFTWRVIPNNSGSTTAGPASGNTFTYSAGATPNTVDTLVCADPTGKVARATINVVSQGGAAPLEIRPRYAYYILPGQALNLRAVGGKGTISWTISQNNSGGGLSGTVGSNVTYTAGTAVTGFVRDTVQISDSTGDWDVAWFYVYRYPITSLWAYPAYIYYDYNTGAGKSRNGLVTGQVVNITTTNGTASDTWAFAANRSGATLTGSGQSAVYTAGATTNVTDYLTVQSGSLTRYLYYKVLPPPMSVSPANASVFGGTTVTFTSFGGGTSKTWAVIDNDSGASLSGSTGASVTYTAGRSPGVDVVRVSDGVSWADVSVSVLAAANATSIRCSHLDVWHGELDINGRPLTVYANATDPKADGVAVFSNGGIGGAANPRLTMAAAGSALTVDRTFVWSAFADENVTAGTIVVGGSLKVTEDTNQPVPFDLGSNSGTSTVILTANNPDATVVNNVDVWHATVNGSSSPVTGCLKFATLQRGAGNSANNIRFLSNVAYSNYTVVTPAPTESPSASGSCAGGTNLPPGFTLYTNPSAQPITGTINGGVWLRSNNSTTTSWQNQSSPYNQCWVVTGTVTINGGLVIENGCLDLQGTLIVNGDVYVGIGNLTQDRNLNPTLRCQTGTPVLQVQESSPGSSADGNFYFNPGATATITRGTVSVDTSLKVADDPGTSPASGRFFRLLGASGTPVTLVLAGAGQEGGASARVYRVNATGGAQPLEVDNLVVAKAAVADVVDFQGATDVWSTLDVDRGTLVSSNGWSLRLLGATWETERGGVAAYSPSLVVWLDGSTGVSTITVRETGTGTAPVLPTVYVNHAGASGWVQLGSSVTARNWFVQDGTFAPSGFALATLQDVAIGLGSLTQDRANDPTLRMTAGADAVLAGRHFFFFPGATEAVDAGTLGAQGDFSITDDPTGPTGATGRVFDLQRDLSGTVNGTSTLLLSGPDVSTPSGTAPARCFRQDSGNNPRALAVYRCTVSKGASATLALWSNLDVADHFTLTSGTLSGVNGTLLLQGHWTTTGGQYSNFPAGITVTGTGTQVFTGAAGSPVPAVQVNKPTGAGPVQIGGTAGSGQLFEVGGNFWIQDGTVDLNGNELRIAGDLFLGTPDAGGTIQTGLTRTAEPTIEARHATQATLQVKRASATAGGTFAFFPGSRERLEHALVRLERHGQFQDDTSGATGATGRAFDLHRDSPATGAPAVHSTPTKLVIAGPDNATVWRSDDTTAGLVLDVRDLEVNKVPTATTVTFQTPIRAFGTYGQRSGTVAAGTIYVNGNWTATGGSYGAAVSVVVQGTQNQTFQSAIVLPAIFIDKQSGGTVSVPTGKLLQTGNFTIMAGTVDVSGGTLEVNGNFALGVNATPNTNSLARFLLSSDGATSSGLGGTLDVRATGTTNGNFWVFSGAAGQVDTGLVAVVGDVMVADVAFAFTDYAGANETAGTPGSLLSLRGNRGAVATVWATQPSAAPALQCWDSEFDKSGAGTGAQVNVSSTLTVTNALTIRGNTALNGALGTAGPIEVHGTLSTSGTTASVTPVTTIEIKGSATQACSSTIPLGVVTVDKPTASPAQVNSALESRAFIVRRGTLDVNGGTLTVSGFLQVGTGVLPATTPAPTLLIQQTSGGGTVRVRATGSQGGEGTLYWLADAAGTLDGGAIELEGGLDVRSLTWDPSVAGSTHRTRLVGTRGSTVLAVSTVTPTGFAAPTLRLQDLEVAKTGSSPGDRVDFTASDVAVAGTLTLTSGTINTDMGSGAFIVRLLGGLAGTGGGFTPTSWVSFEGSSAQAAGGTGGVLPNVQVNKSQGSLPADEVTFSGAMTMTSLLVRDGSFVVADPPTSSTAIATTGAVQVGTGTLATDRTNAPEFRMTTTGTLAVGTDLSVWAGARERILSGTVRIGRSLQAQEDSATGGNAFDLTTDPVAGATQPVVEFVGNNPGACFLVDQAGAPRNLNLFDATVAKTTGVALTATGPTFVKGTLRMQSGLLGTSNGGAVHVQGAWTHTGGAYVPGSQFVLDGTGTQSLQSSAGAALPSITVDKPSGVAQVPSGGAAQVGTSAQGELFWIRQGTFDLNGGTLVVHGVGFVGDSGSAISQSVAPSLASSSAASVLEVNPTSQPPAGFSQDGDLVVGMNGTGNTPATAVNAATLAAGTLRIRHRLAIDDPNFATGGATQVVLDGNAGAQGPGEAWSVRPAAAPLLVLAHVEIAKTGGGQGATARLLSPCVVNGHVQCTSGTFDLANQPRLDVGGNWTVSAAASVQPTVTPVRFVGSTPSTVTVNSGSAPFFDAFVQKTAGATTMTLQSTSTPAQPSVIERQLVVAQGTAAIAAGHRAVVGSGSWVGNVRIGTGVGAATAVVGAGGTLAFGPGASVGVDQAATLVQVGTGASARARLTSVQPGVARWSGVVNGTWRVQWFEVSSPDARGLQLGSTAQVTGAGQDLSDGLWDWPANGGVLLDLASTDGTTGKPVASYRNVFQNTGSATGAGNVAAGTTTTAIRFLNATGALAGEGFDVEPSGPGPVYWNVATLQVGVASNTPAAASVLATQSGIGLAAWTVRETSGTEGADVTALTLSATSGSATTGWTNLRCWLDADRSGTVTSGDTQLGATQSGFTSGAMTIAGTPLVQVPAGGSVTLLLAADTSSATAPSTLAVEIRASTDVVATGNSSGLSAQVPGRFPATGNTMSVQSAGRLTVALGPESPAAGNILSTSSSASQNVVMGQWVLRADSLEAHDLTGVTITDVSTGSVTGITNVRLFLDNGPTPGVLDAPGDTQLGTATTYNGSRVATFSGLPLATIAAGGARTVLLVQDFPTGLAAGTTYQAELTSISATGNTSGAAALTAGTPSQSTVQTVAANGSVTVQRDPNSPASTGVVKTATGHVMGQWRVQVSAAEAMALSQWVVTDGGTATASSAVSTVRLYVDANGDGQLQGTDPQVGGNATFSGSTATVALSPALVLGAGSTTRFLVVYDCSGNGSAGQTLDARLADGTALAFTGQTSAVAVTALAQPSYPVSGGAWTLTDGPPVLSFAVGTGHPPVRTVPANQSGVVVAVAQVSATGENQTVTALSVAGSGTANDTTAVSAVRMFDDGTGTMAGQLDAGDTAIGTAQTFSADDGTVTFSGLAWSLAKGASRDLLLVYDFNAPGVSPGTTVRATISACVASGDTSGSASQVSGLPFDGNVQTLAVPGALAVSAGSRMPTAQTVAPGTAAVPVWQGRLQAGTAEDLLVTGMQVRPAVGTSATFFGTVRLFWDANGNGQFESGVDVLIAAPGQFSGSPKALNWALAQRISAGTQQDWLIVADVQGTMGQSGALEVPGGGVTVQGLSSGLTDSTGVGVTGLPQSGGTVRVGATGSVACYVGAQTSPGRTEPAGTAGIPVAQFTLRASPVEAATLTRLVVTHAGSGAAATDVGAVRLWVDADGDGRVGATENQLGTTRTFAGITATFTGLSQAVLAGGDLHVVVTYDLATGASNGATFRAQLFANGDVSVSGQASGGALPVAGTPVMGNLLTVGTAPGLLASAGAPWPAPIYLPPNSLPAAGVVLAPLRLEATSAAGVDLTGLTLTASGTGDDRLLGVRVHADQNADGRIDGGDTLLGFGSFGANNGTWTLSLSPAVTLAAGATAQWLVSYDVPAGVGADATFTLRLVPAADVAAVQTGSTTPASVSGPALQSPPVMIGLPPGFGGAAITSAGSSGGGCFVATAAGDGAVADALRAARDGWLPAGAVRAYYRQSPPVAAAIVDAPAARAAVRGALSALAGWLGGGVPLWVLMVGLAALGALATRRRTGLVRRRRVAA